MRADNGAAGGAVVGIGQCSWDHLAMVAQWPDPDDKVETLVWEEQGGGPVATALVTLARLGVRCRFYGVVGDDPTGEKIRRSLRDERIEVSGLLVRPEASSQRAFVAVEADLARRTIFWQRPTGEPLHARELEAGWLDGCRFLLLDGLMGLVSLEAARQARSLKIPVMLDAGRDRPGMRELAGICDHVVAAERFFRDLGWDGTEGHFTGIADSFGASLVTVTLGAEGSITRYGGETIRTPAFRVDVIDTTGAGDVFHGGLVYGILQGWEVRRSLTFASAAAAMACTRLGGRTGIPGRDAVDRFLEADRRRTVGVPHQVSA